MISFTANGKEYNKTDSLSVTAFLRELHLTPQTVIVEYNHEYLDKISCESTILQDGDTLEIVRAFAGG